MTGIAINTGKWAAWLAFAVSLAVGGCGSDDDDGGGGGSAIESCKAACDAREAGDCSELLTVDECKELCDAFSQASASCQEAVGDQSDCELSQPDICDSTAVANACDSETQAVNNECATSS